jgi:hypothetical protein
MGSDGHALAGRIIAACEDAWPEHKHDCNSFVKTVASSLGISLHGNADSIVDQISMTPWQSLSDGVSAKHAADAGRFVVAGLRGREQYSWSPHGHVVVVVAGPLAHGFAPSAYWGHLGGIGARHTTINWAWNHNDLGSVHYSVFNAM